MMPHTRGSHLPVLAHPAFQDFGVLSWTKLALVKASGGKQTMLVQ